MAFGDPYFWNSGPLGNDSGSSAPPPPTPGGGHTGWNPGNWGFPFRSNQYGHSWGGGGGSGAYGGQRNYGIGSFTDPLTGQPITSAQFALNSNAGMYDHVNPPAQPFGAPPVYSAGGGGLPGHVGTGGPMHTQPGGGQQVPVDPLPQGGHPWQPGGSGQSPPWLQQFHDYLTSNPPPWLQQLRTTIGS